MSPHPTARNCSRGSGRANDPWASLLLVHGLGEHSGRYEHVGDHLAAAGIDTHAYDQRGNGASGGARGDIDRWSRFHDDLEEQLVSLRQSADGRPVVLYAHSLGGLVAAGYLIDGRPRPDFTVLSAPGLDSTLARWKLALAPVVARGRRRSPFLRGSAPRRSRVTRRSVVAYVPTR